MAISRTGIGGALRFQMEVDGQTSGPFFRDELAPKILDDVRSRFL